MSKIREVFNRSKDVAFIPYITAGYPDLHTSVALGTAIAAAGADIIELGIPFSDPLADGPVIQASFQKALDAGINLDSCFQAAAGIKAEADIPLIFMIAYNLVLQKGIRNFADSCVQHGVDGVIIPDLPPESADADHAVFSAAGIDMVFLIAPNTPPDRRELVLKYSSGYLYCLSRLGITGAQTDLADGLAEYLDEVRRNTDLPLCLGFGISKPEHVQQIRDHVDGAIVGSAIVKMVTEYAHEPDRMIQEVSDYVKAMKAAGCKA